MRNTMSTRTLLPGAAATTESPATEGRVVVPVVAARLRPIRTWAAVVSKPAGMSAGFPLAGNASLIRFQIARLIAGGAAASISATETLSKYVPTLLPIVGVQVAAEMAVKV